MITPEYVQLMARYNAWQNLSLYNGADRLPDSERKRDCGAFFGSIHGTLCHLLFGDQAWLHRFTGTTPAPRAKSILESTTAIADWEELKRERFAFDQVISDWAQSLDAHALLGDHTWTSGAMKRDVTRPMGMLVAHMFNHQTHHRGQVHCLLTQAGIKPEDTDIPFMPSLM
ncbi:MAG: DinB family protein [Novosphingobium sp.]|nr:damage-inducible protein DinB [Hyphomicrobiaceae bacterium]